ncbi:hypothetical protein HW130_32185 [Streptomyces sp. PKU-EA00015]|uniref:hypothetical protein n=1 Tax=Streptomyces sp. PKU-EA00015 TaxID=2748326 RepID=UPI00159F9C29|nr:hypothetical protein [Streptomyces sp. PKU-EA00015]NWF30853.1 hypothetical protein [Streptomyces sp. PKU-EA00015]
MNDQQSADEVIGDLFAYIFLLADGRATPDQLTRAAEEMRSTRYPVTLNALCEVTAADVERVAAMLAACMDAAEHFGCDVPGMLHFARLCAEDMKAEEAHDNALTAVGAGGDTPGGDGIPPAQRFHQHRPKAEWKAAPV